MGGGTTLVEARSLGRVGVGSDISALAHFLTDAKTTVYSDEEISAVSDWALEMSGVLKQHFSTVLRDSALRDLSRPTLWRTRNLISVLLCSVERLKGNEQKLARVLILRTAQWALDCRKHTPSRSQFRDQMRLFLAEMIEGAADFRTQVCDVGKPNVYVENRPAQEIAGLIKKRKMDSPKLILTSPPYPGVHVLYHRWQIRGRKETALPFAITSTNDGHGPSYYTMGGRHAAGIRSYFEQARSIFSSLREICTNETVLLQLIAFSKCSSQLPAYLQMMRDCGFSEMQLPTDSSDRRLWREVPNRKWYADVAGRTDASREVLLVHKRS